VVNIRPLRQSVRPSPVFLLILGATAAGGVMAWLAANERSALAYAGVFVFVMAGWVASLSLHEFGHAFTAWRFGDRDVEARGYLTLNPLKYSHPALSIALPLVFILLGGIGLPGGAVYVRTKWMTAKQRTIVSLAGPFANAVLAVVLLTVTAVFFDLDTRHGVFWAGVAFLGLLQVMALLLNLLPIPGLDGYGALEPHLSFETQRALEPAKQWGFVILFVLLFIPPVNYAFFSLVQWVFSLSGVTPLLAGMGNGLTRFWSAWF
jgi:Zn-dependent protease